MAVRDDGEVPNWLLDQAQEDALHANRLINIEERPFQRISKALLGKTSTIRNAVTHYPSPPPDENEETSPKIHDPAHLQTFREHILLDFAALESSLVRIQLIHTSNEKERDRFAAEKAKILSTAQAVRENTLKLRTQLAEAQKVLKLRKGYDSLASKILDDQKLKSRDETRSEIMKLEKEIEDLEEESAEYEGTWVSRREQFDRLIAEGQAMLRLIKGIKDESEEADKDEEMDDDEGTKEHASRLDSEGPDDRTPRPAELGDATPLPDHGEGGASTPANKSLDVDDLPRTGSRIVSPLSRPTETDDDVDMAEPVLSLDSATPSARATGLASTEVTDDMEVT